MADHNEDKDWQLDALLDSLLRSYSAADPRPGFETRLRAVAAARATRVRRTNLLMLAASAAAVVLFAWIMIAKTRPAQPTVPDHVAIRNPIPAPPAVDAGTEPPVTKKAPNPLAGDRVAKVRRDPDSRIVLKIVEATRESRNVVFEREKLYLTPEALPESQAAPAEPAQAQAPAITIQELGVAPIATSAPIEIKDISSPKSATEKGSL
jgi:hypothetical protein